MAQAAILRGGQLEVDNAGFIITFSDAYPKLSINAGIDGEWKANATNAITQAIMGQLSDRLIDPEVEDNAPRKGSKDLYGIDGAVDVATRALIASTVAPLLKKHAKMLHENGVKVDLAEIRESSIQHQRVQSIIVGSLRAHDRIHEFD